MDWDPIAFPSRSLACLLCSYGAFSAERHRARGGVVDSCAGSCAPFGAKDQLCNRGYRWMPRDRDGSPRSWWRDVHPDDLEAEFAWLRELYLAHSRWLNPDRLPRREVTARDCWRGDPLEFSAT